MQRVLERLLNLLAYLRTVGRPVTVDEIRFTVAGYDPDNDSSFHRMFERDKALLREAGVPIETVVIDEFNHTQGYVLPPERLEMNDPDLDDEELAALALAAGMVRLGTADVIPALHKLGGADADAEAPTTTNLGDVEGLTAAFEAVTERRLLTMTYRGKERRVEPYGLLHRRGNWYLVAGVSGERRVFRIDRGSDWQVGPDEDAFTRPDELDLRGAIAATPWELGDTVVEASVRIDDDIAWWALRQLGDVPTSREDGHVVVRVPVANRGAFLSWLFDLGTSAEVLAPPELRAAVIEHLEVAR